MADERLSYQIDARDRASATFKKVGSAAKGTKKDLDETSEGAKRLSKQMDETRSSLANLHKEFERTGDLKFLKQIRRGERDMKNMSGWMQHFAAVAGTGVKSATSLGETLAGFGKGPAIGVLAAGAALAAVPALAAVAGAALAGVGAGFLGLAAFAVSGSAKVQHAAAGIQDAWLTAVQKSAKGTEQHFVRALNILQATADDVGPALAEVFDAVGPSAENLARGINQLAVNAMPGLAKAGVASASVLDRLEPAFADLGASVGDFGESLSGAAEGGGAALVDMIGLLGNGIETLGHSLEGASKSYQWLLKDPGWQKWIPPVAIARGFNDWATGADHTADANQDTQDSIDAMSRALPGLGEATKAQAEATKAAADAAKEEAEALERVIASYTTLGRITLSARDVERDYQKAVDDATESLKDHGRTLDSGTEKGRANQAALDAIASTTLRKAENDLKAGASQASVNFTMERGKAAYIAAATAMGQPIAQAQALANKLFAIPKNNTIRVAATGISITLQQLEQISAAERRISGLVSIHARVTGASSAIATLNQLSARARAGVAGAGATGGLVGNLGPKKGFAGGGIVAGGGTTTSDSIPIWASRREFVTNAKATASIGVKNMEFMNRTGKIPVPAMAGRGGVTVVLQNHGVIGSRVELENWLVRSVDSLRRQNRI